MNRLRYNSKFLLLGVAAGLLTLTLLYSVFSFLNQDIETAKKELAGLNRERIKLERNLRGIRHMGKIPDAVVIVDSAREHIAVHESRRLKIPIVALVDTNADPNIIDYPIAANDDAIRSIRIILQKLIDPVIVATAELKK